MRILALCIVFLFIFGGAVQAEWVVCNPAPENNDADPGNDVVNVVIMQDAAEIIRPYELHSSGAVLLVDTTLIASALFSFRFENGQGRRSEPVIFDLSEKPAGCTGVRVMP